MNDKSVLSIIGEISYLAPDSEFYNAHLLKLTKDIFTDEAVNMFKMDLVNYFSNLNGKKYNVILDTQNAEMNHKECLSALLIYNRLCDNNNAGTPGLIVAKDSTIYKEIQLEKVDKLFNTGSSIEDVIAGFRASKSTNSW